MNPEKKFWTAEIELYRWVMSNGPHGRNKIEKRSICFWISGPFCKRVIVDRRFFDVLASAGALKVADSSPKIDFCSNFDSKYFFLDFSKFYFVVPIILQILKFVQK